MKTFATLLVAGLFALSVGCSKSDKKDSADNKPAKPNPEAKTPAPTKPAPTPEEAPIADEDLPVAADFEEEVEKEVSANNYKDALQALEAELAKEDGAAE